MPRHTTTLGVAVLAAAAASAFAPRAAVAQYSIYTGNVGGFVPNSATAPFTAAIGGSADEHLDFSLDRFGNPTVSPAMAGTDFSPNMIFSTRASAFGGITGGMVNSSGAGAASEIGPYDTWYGTLVIDFLGAGKLANAVGFGTVEWDNPAETIRIFDQNGALAYASDAATLGGYGFGFVGAVANGGTKIGRVELDGDFYAIQDISVDYAITATPEPASLALTATGLVGLVVAARRRRRA